MSNYLFDTFNGSKNLGDLEENQANIDQIKKENKSLKEKLKSTLDELEKLKKDLMKGDIINGERFTLLEID
jgi:predicted nuclease with TOPRIM domain